MTVSTTALAVSLEKVTKLSSHIQTSVSLMTNVYVVANPDEDDVVSAELPAFDKGYEWSDSQESDDYDDAHSLNNHQNVSHSHSSLVFVQNTHQD